MGNVIYLADRLAARTYATSGPRPAFFFDLACPMSYLAAERVERVLGEVEWIPAMLSSSAADPPRARTAAHRAHAETLAIALRIPLVWPDGFPAPCPGAMRAACHAAEIGAAAGFALAAGRLAFCGGFDLEDPDILAEAAAAAGVQPEYSLAAAADPAYDAHMHATARRLRSAGVSELPAISIDSAWLDGEAAAVEALALRRDLRFGRG